MALFGKTDAVAPAADEGAAAAAVPAATDIDVESVEDGYVNASVVESAAASGGTGGTPPRKSPVASAESSSSAAAAFPDSRLNLADDATKIPFDGVRGQVQPPKYKDLKYAILFGLHLTLPAFWFLGSFGKYYDRYVGYVSPLPHGGMTLFVVSAAFVGILCSFLAFGYMLRHGETMLKTTLAWSILSCVAVGVLGFVSHEWFVAVCGFGASVAAFMYANMVWSRIPVSMSPRWVSEFQSTISVSHVRRQFTAVNISGAISAIRTNMGLFVSSLLIAGIGLGWFIVATIAGISAHRKYGWWTILYSLFSYYWTLQVLVNIASVATAGVVGRWIVAGQDTRVFNRAMVETLNKTRTYGFGSICFGSLFFGVVQVLQGLSSYLLSKSVPYLPRALDWILLKIGGVIDEVNEWAYVYIGLYGYSYTNAAKNVTTLFQNKGWDRVVKFRLAGNIVTMASMSIGMITGFSGMMHGATQGYLFTNSGLLYPTVDGFFVGFLMGFAMSSIILNIVTVAMKTLVVAFVESPEEFKANHPELCEKLSAAWNEQKAGDAGEEA
ncbi:hypothetical protein ACHAWF_005309 [Thalassiosira exigua]